MLVEHSLRITIKLVPLQNVDLIDERKSFGMSVTQVLQTHTFRDRKGERERFSERQTFRHSETERERERGLTTLQLQLITITHVLVFPTAQPVGLM